MPFVNDTKLPQGPIDELLQLLLSRTAMNDKGPDKHSGYVHTQRIRSTYVIIDVFQAKLVKLLNAVTHSVT